ncbi:ImmA/IrrE family metallo-endopeptidase [Coprococcus comes]|uniref:ImmA/IrrE family metallo-endopeptidase n=1 Tax=Coprococcus comes TaxID=410072 RepID=UPI00189B143B|nr:ImmA/IrrE family metallo-endopeptidase [Coprococcus comes]MDB1812278.1 ImmA/IrrE family metallo-endopeptidase [Coprococcus comes]MDB1815234.1 ImmA/IrrE family metallo-endopeptidase [Coprococcus comes]
MNKFEKLEDVAYQDDVDVLNYRFESNNIKGLYCDGVIAIREDMTIPEKTCALAEELGHHETSVGNIIDMTSAANRKQERQARLWAYNKQIGLIRLVRAFEHGCQNRFEIAEYLEVTEEFLEECIECYRNKYGICKQVDNYVVYFIPQLSVMKLV